MGVKKYQFLEHTADIKFKVWGKSLEKVFENSALALSEIFSRSSKVDSTKTKKIELEEENHEALLYSFIDELIFFLDAEHFIVSKAKVKISGSKLSAVIYGDDSLRYPGLEHVKAATYSEMYVKKVKEGWEAQLVVDM